MPGVRVQTPFLLRGGRAIDFQVFSKHRPIEYVTNVRGARF